jgi:hypothetical protein
MTDPTENADDRAHPEIDDPDLAATAYPETMPVEDDVDHLDYIRAIIRHRVPEATEEDLAAAFGDQPVSYALPAEIGAAINEALDEVTVRLDTLAEAVGVSRDDDDDVQ